MADEWMARQGRLVGWLRVHGNALAEVEIVQAVSKFLVNWRGYYHDELRQTFIYSRNLKQKELERAQHEG